MKSEKKLWQITESELYDLFHDIACQQHGHASVTSWANDGSLWDCTIAHALATFNKNKKGNEK